MFGETVLVINGQEYVEIETEKEDTIEQSVCEVEEDDDNTSGDKNTGGLEKSDYDEQYSNEECEIKIEEEDIYKRITKREADENNINFDGQSTKILMRQYSDSANVDQQLKLKERKCDFTTGENSSLKIHIGSGHLNSRENQCHLCDYAAKRRGYLKVHIENVHMNLKKHQCAMCDYKTCVKNSLKMHISSVHLQLKQFKCDSCEYIAKRKCTLRDHVEAVHLNLKNHRCEKCPYSTQRKTTLNDHISTVHLNMKKHECHVCEYKTNHKGTLKRHIQNVHLKLQV